MSQHTAGRHRRAEPFAATTAARSTGTTPRRDGTRGAGDVAWGAGGGEPHQAGRLARWTRPRSVRAKVVTLLIVPVIALMALWGLATVKVVGDALTVKQVAQIQAAVRDPLQRSVSALEAERAAVVTFLGSKPAQSTDQALGRTPGQGGNQATNSPLNQTSDLAAIAAANASLAPQRAATDSATVAVRSAFLAARVQTAALPSVQTGAAALLADFDRLASLRDRVAARQIPAIEAYDAYTGAIGEGDAVLADLAAQRSAHLSSIGEVSGVVLGAFAIVVSLLISVRTGRGLVLELVGLRNSALDLAGRRLPAAIARLRAGQEIDLAAEAPPPAAGGHGEDEVGQVAEALAVVQRAALEAAVERAEVVSGVAGVFLNLARRSQTLVHRQLALLESMERRVDDPDELEDLFRLDHLATRMRRHAEGLIILSGSPPGRGWRRPVPLMDVIRAAASEVEDFARVDVRRMPRVSVAGGAVADLTHLVAELVENATSFSPPHSRVLVQGRRRGRDCYLEVRDEGLGMSRSAMEDANRRIADARPHDLFESDQLGLYVVSRLARRHGIEAWLQAADDDARGTVAVLLLPAALLASDDEAPHDAGEQPVTADVGATAGNPMDDTAGEGGGDRRRQESAAMPSASDVSPPHVSTPRMSTPRQSAARTGEPGPEPFSADPRIPPPLLLGENGLPRRVRQASLAAQLRTAGLEDLGTQGSDAYSDGAAPLRSPETARATMSALQQGWTRGRGTEPEEAS